MIETATIHEEFGEDGRLSFALAVQAPPGREVDVILSIRTRPRFYTREAWDCHVKEIAGSVQDIERPIQYTLGA
jgi:hypothetical protein